MSYFFALGNHPNLSLAELQCQLGFGNWQSYGSLVTLNDETVSVAAGDLMSVLGGTIKIGLIVARVPEQGLIPIVHKFLAERAQVVNSGKFYFGISCYQPVLDVKKFGLQLKKLLKASAISSRFVESREPVLSSVVVTTNKLLSDRGAEIVLVKDGALLLVGVTRAVQQFAEFSERDYGRPARDARSGMLPPKIARIMINLARLDRAAVILDPFCGSGTILQEALILGYQNIIGADVSEQAIEDTKQNLKWLNDAGSGLVAKFSSAELARRTSGSNSPRAKISPPAPRLFISASRHLSQQISLQSVDAIITEPYLGPALRGGESQEEIGRIQLELTSLYLDSFKEFQKILKSTGRVVIILPVINGQYLSILDEVNKLGFVQDPKFSKLYDNQARQSFLYGRSGQRIKREILVLNSKF